MVLARVESTSIAVLETVMSDRVNFSLAVAIVLVMFGACAFAAFWPRQLQRFYVAGCHRGMQSRVWLMRKYCQFGLKMIQPRSYVWGMRFMGFVGMASLVAFLCLILTAK